MLSCIFPKQIDNTLVMLLKATQDVASIVYTRDVVTTADGIPLDSFDAAGIEFLIAVFAVTGLYLLVLPLQSAVVLIRYRAVIPFMYLLFLIVQAGNRVLPMLHPIVRSDARPIGFYVNLAIFAMTLIGFVLSLQNRSDLPVGKPARPGARGTLFTKADHRSALVTRGHLFDAWRHVHPDPPSIGSVRMQWGSRRSTSMMDQIEKVSRAVTFVSHEAFKRVSGNLSLLARMFGVAAIGVAAVDRLNHVAPSFVLGGPGDVTAFVTGQVRALAHVSLKLMALGRDVFAFFGAS